MDSDENYAWWCRTNLKPWTIDELYLFFRRANLNSVSVPRTWRLYLYELELGWRNTYLMWQRTILEIGEWRDTLEICVTWVSVLEHSANDLSRLYEIWSDLLRELVLRTNTTRIWLSFVLEPYFLWDDLLKNYWLLERLRLARVFYWQNELTVEL